MKGKAKAAEFVGEGYKVHVTGRHVLVTDAMKQYAIDKISRFERLSPRIIDVQVWMDIQKLEHRVDIVIKVDHIKIKSHAASTDMYTSIDSAVDKIERQIRRYKTKIRDHTAKSLKVVDLKVNVLKLPAEEEVIDVNMAIDDANEKELYDRFRPHEVISKKTKPLKILTLDEAVMKMELSGDAFLVYRNEQDMKLKIIYRREDGNYGIMAVEP